MRLLPTHVAIAKMQDLASELPDSPYDSLDPERREIRILHVKGNENSDEILDCTLEVVSLYSDTEPGYEAISYCWSEYPGTGEMRLNGRLISAPASAVHVLRQFRSKTTYRTLWIDAICINQADLEERASQVSIMEHIYRNCSLCLVWLGEANAKTQQLLVAIDCILDHLYDQLAQTTANFSVLPEPNSRYEDVLPDTPFGSDIIPEELMNFYCRSWFSRVWVLQEAVLAPDTACYCGDWTLPFHKICRLAAWTQIEYCVGKKISDDTLVQAAKTGLTLASLARRLVLSAVRPEDPVGSSEILFDSLFLESSDSRDKFYGVLGLLNQFSNVPTSPSWLKVDYSRSCDQVSRDAARMVIIKEGSLELFCVIDSLGEELRDVSRLEVSSWVIPLASRGEAIARIPFLSIPVYASARMDLGNIDSSYNEHFLFLEGFKIATVSHVFTSNSLSLLRSLSSRHNKASFWDMFGEAVHELHKSGKFLLIRQALILVFGRDQDVDQGVDWLAFANRFTDLYIHHNCKAYGVVDEMLDEMFEVFPERRFTESTPLWRGRRLFFTSEGGIGMGHVAVREGDQIAVLFGCLCPFILRRGVESMPEYWPSGRTSNDQAAANACRFVGLAGYVVGSDEAVQKLEESYVEPTTFCLW